MPIYELCYNNKKGDNMRKRINNKYLFIFTTAILLCIFFIAYAQINKVNLFINGTASDPGIKSSEDFKVKFTDAIIGDQMDGIVVENDESQFSDRKAVFNVEGMLAYGDEANITYEITNESKYHSALLQATSTVINNNPAHFAVERSIVNSNNQIVSKITPGEKAYYKIKVKVIKVPTSTAQTASITVYLNAESEPYTGS